MRLRKSIDRRRKRMKALYGSGQNDRRWTDKRQADAGEKRFIELLNSSSQPFLIHDFDFHPLLINNSYAKSLGYSINEVWRINDIQYLYKKSDVPKMKGHLNSLKFSLQKDENPTTYEINAYHKNGRLLILQHTVSLVDWKGMEAVLVAVNDISENATARQALELSEQRFRDFAESASDWCWEMDKNYRFTFISESFERITGNRAADIIGLTREEFSSRYMNKKLFSEEEKESWRQHKLILESKRPFSDFIYRYYRKDGSSFVMTTNGKPIFNKYGQFIGYRGAAKDITSEQSLTEQLNYRATHDELTDLMNRSAFDHQLHKVIDDAHINGNEHVLVYMDLDRFKIVNDTCGHIAGDALLQQLSRLFRTIFKQDDSLARLGGDEFAVIMPNCSIDNAFRTTLRLHEAMESFRFIWDNKIFSVGVSIGIVNINRHSESVTRLLQDVDSACFKAKNTGRNKTLIFSENDADLSRRQGEMRWASSITQALEDDAFVLFSQAIIPLQKEGTKFYELLVRIMIDGEIIAPQSFLPAAERYDLALLLDKWILRKAILWIAENESLLTNTELFFINLSGKTIGQQSFTEFASRLLKEHRSIALKVCFEITETAAITNLAEANDFIAKLKTIGCQFALDDFGSGVSSFAYLKNLPVDFLKIDGMFVRDICSNAVNMAMVRSINEISHVMGKKTIAEFVEDNSTLEALRSMGIDYAQGFAIHHPEPIEKLIMANPNSQN